MPDNYVQSDKTESIAQAAELFAAHGDFLLNVFQKELDEQDARDLWQNLFLSLVNHPVPNDVLNTRSYLYRAAVNDIIDFKRVKKFKKEKMLEYTEIIRKRGTHISPIRDMIGREALLGALKRIKRDLPRKIGQAVLHKYSNQMNHREIAEKMNIKRQTVNKYLSIGTKMMEQMQDQIKGDENG